MTTAVEVQLSEEECDALRRVAQDEKASISAAAAARLELLGLIMHGWSHTHVITATGTRLLSQLPY
jgi:hypothetical protein